MKKLAIATLAFGMIGGAAAAADLPVRGPAMAPAPMAYAPYNWSGFYVGAVGSFGVLSSDMSDHWCDTACDAPDRAKWGGGIGGTLGFNFQSGNFVYGIEGDASWTGMKNSFHYRYAPNGNFNYQSIHEAKWDWYGTVRARFGLAMDRTLAYVTGGVAFVGAKYRANYFEEDGSWDGGFRPTSGTQTGFAVGGGIEHAFTQNLTFKAEYMYIGLPSKDGGNYCDEFPCGDDSRITYRSNAHLARLGLNYKFGGGGSVGGPVVARY